MQKVIDFYHDLPDTPEMVKAGLAYFWIHDPNLGYRRAFGEKLAAKYGLTDRQLSEAYDRGGRAAFDEVVMAALKGHRFQSMEEYLREMDDNGVVLGFTSDSNHDNRASAELCRQYPDKLAAYYYADPHRLMDDVRDFEFCVKELGARALYISAFRTLLPANDKKYYPIYAKACELKVPVVIYVAMNFTGTIPAYVGHISYLDEVARDFPELKIMASVCYPWASDTVAMLVRHKNMFFSLEVMDYGEMAEPNSDFAPYLYYLRDKRRDIDKKLCFASNCAATAITVRETIDRVKNLPLPDATIENILYNNGLRFLED